MSSDEVTAICPVTGQPDYYKVTIYIKTNGYGIESKSLKLYLQKFRNMGIFAENFAAAVCHDVQVTTQAHRTIVTVEQKPRGGVTLVARADSGAVATMGPVQAGD